MEDVAEPFKPLKPPSTHAPDLPPQVLDDNEDEFDTDLDEGSKGLLSSTHGPSYIARYLETIWPQVKSIVIEVRCHELISGTEPFIFVFRVPRRF